MNKPKYETFFDRVYKKEKLRCGDCGGEDHKLLEYEDDIYTKCVGCESVSIIVVPKPKLDIQWTIGSNGILAKY